MRTDPAEFAGPDDVRAYLATRGLPAGSGVPVERLSGGVSSLVYQVRAGDDCLVLKQARARLDVAREWLSDPRRSMIEAAFADEAWAIVPGRVPRGRFADADRHVFGMDCAPDGSVTWKTELLTGVVDQDLARQAGDLIGRIHGATRGRADVAARFADQTIFDELRVDPYLRSLTTPDAAVQARALAIAARLLEPGECLVHGDYSPKNLLVTRDRRLLLIDHEVAHFGDPSFDLAFCLNHLCLKSFHVPGSSVALRDAAGEFLAAYGAASGSPDADLDRRTASLLAALMLARIDGKSPVEYLDELTRVCVREFAIAQLLAMPMSIADVLDAVATAAAGAGTVA
jgi:aminoglycoside phosphotransferase (APT) family kinase protein